MDISIIIQTLNVIASALIAWFIYYQAKANNFDNRVATLPYLIITDASQTIRDNGEQRYQFAYGVANQGMGPAVIDKWELHYDGEKLVAERNEELFDFLADKSPVPIIDQNPRKFTTTSVIPAEHSLEIVTVETDIQYKDDFITFMRDEFIEKLHFKIHYQSIYEDEIFVLDSHLGHIDWHLA